MTEENDLPLLAYLRAVVEDDAPEQAQQDAAFPAGTMEADPAQHEEHVPPQRAHGEIEPIACSGTALDDAERITASRHTGESVSVSSEPVPRSEEKCASTPRCGVTGDDPSFMFLKEAVRIQTTPPKPPAQHDYRSLLHPIQEMLAPAKGKGPAVCACGHARGKTVKVHLIDRKTGGQRASVTGIYRCGGGEICPVCAPHVAALRAKRYRRVHEATNALGGTMVTFVFTVEHDPGDRLSALLKAIKQASTRARSDRFWNQKIKPLMNAKGALVDVHVRYNRCGGWHPHLHVTLPCLTDNIEDLRAGASMLLERYIALLAQSGYRAGREQQSATLLDARPNAYPAHHHRRAKVVGKLAEAMDDETSLSPFDIAELADTGDVEMRGLFVEFAAAMRGSRSCVVTAAMAEKLGIEPSADPTPRFDEDTLVGTLPSPVWTRLMELNLVGTFLTTVETHGREGWGRSKWWAFQQTGLAPPILPELAREMMAMLRAIAMLPNEVAQALGRNAVAKACEAGMAENDPGLIEATLDYAEAHWAFLVTEDDPVVEHWRSIFETLAGKAALRVDRHARPTVPIG